jgi:hypothetical protein
VAFLTPFAGLVALAGLLPVAAFLYSERGRRRVTRLLQLSEPSRRVRLTPALAVVVVAASLGLAATQPTVVRHEQHRVRTDAEAWFVLDTSLSMKAAASASSPSRFERAQSLAIRLRDELADLPVGLASVTDRVLPHLFPTGDRDSFALTVRKVMGIQRPPPTDGFSTRITTLGSIARVANGNFYSTSASKRLLVVFTDGETKPFTDESLGTIFRAPPGVRTIFVRIWGPEEHVFSGRQVDPLYRPDPASATYIRQLAQTTGGVAVDARDFGTLVSRARADVGSGPTAVLHSEERRLELAPYFAGFCFLPLAFLLWRRNL